MAPGEWLWLGVMNFFQSLHRLCYALWFAKTLNTSQSVWRLGLTYVRSLKRVNQIQFPASQLLNSQLFRWLPSLKPRACPWKGTIPTGEACLSTIFFRGDLLNLKGEKEDRLALLDNMEDHLLLPDEVIVGAKGGKGGHLEAAHWRVNCGWWTDGSQGNLFKFGFHSLYRLDLHIYRKELLVSPIWKCCKPPILPASCHEIAAWISWNSAMGIGQRFT